MASPAATSGSTLQPNEVHYRLLVDSVRDYAIYMLDPDGRVASWNLGAERIKGYQARDILGKHFSIFYPPEEAAAGKPASDLAVASVEGRFEEEGWRLRQDGSRFWAHLIVTALRDQSGTLVGFGKVTRDLTERIAAENERVARLAAETAVREREVFLAVAAHELKTPLTSLRGFVQLLSRQLNRGADSDPERIRRAVAHIEHQTDNIGRLVARLLDVTRLSTAHAQLVWETVDLAAVARAAVQTTQFQTGTHEIVLASPPAVPMRADAMRLEQIAVNLLDNAIRYSPGGRIEVTVEADEDQARLSVRDWGPGIPPEHREHIFERFQRVHDGYGQGGLGIGLYISREIAQLHGGTLTVECPPDGGARFVLSLPRHGAPGPTPES